MATKTRNITFTEEEVAVLFQIMSNVDDTFYNARQNDVISAITNKVEDATMSSDEDEGSDVENERAGNESD